MKEIRLIETDVLIIGAGIMGATLASILKELDTSLKINMVDMLQAPGMESTEALNNAGTGHAGYCETNYTPEINKSVNIEKAVEINAKFEVSLQYWAYLTKTYKLFKPIEFIRKTPHISIVNGKKDIEYLKKRYRALKKHHLFSNIEFSQNPKIIKKWVPLLKGHVDELAATKVISGTDINFGKITKNLIQILKTKENFKIHQNFKVHKLHEINDHFWKIEIEDLINKKNIEINSKFVFISSGGESINLLQKTKIPEQIGYAGFPVNGKWLICKNHKISRYHNAKVYGKAAEGSPPMSLPHMDLRVIDGEKILLFGPFASFTFKFLRNGSYFSLLNSINYKNLKTIIFIFFKEWKLVLYLLKQTFSSNKNKINQLKKFYPNANSSDWSLTQAGIRVQIIKPSKTNIASLEFGTEIIYNKNRNLAALLGASPGASVAVSSMLEIIEKCFYPNKKWKKKIKKIIPASSEELIKNPSQIKKVRPRSLKSLNLN
jgi:malate dehydrogenase (quinone)